VKKPNFQNHFENFSQLEALRAIIRLSLDIFSVQKMREKQGKWVFSQLQFHMDGYRVYQALGKQISGTTTARMGVSSLVHGLPPLCPHFRHPYQLLRQTLCVGFCTIGMDMP
jgi:hypothetical protein